MAYITLTGVLVDANDNLLPQAQIKFVAKSTSSAVLEHTSAIATTDSNGQYTLNLNYGVYDISVKTSDSFSFYLLVRDVVINAETTETNLNALISKFNEVELITPEILVTMRALEVSASDSADAAATSASAALISEGNAYTSETNAATSESNAATSEGNAATSEFNASQSASAALTSENNASTSESNAATSASNALASEQAAATSAGNASTSEFNAANSEGNAATSATAAATSEANALASEQAASASESNAATSASAASISEDNASTSELNAATSESNASTSEANALQSEQAAATSEGNASAHKAAAENFKNQASASASAAATSESNAANSETLALQYKDQAQAAFENTIKVKGQWDASTGSYPTTPENGDRYYVSGDGVVSGVDYVTGDTITYYTSIGWIHGDNTERVTSVAGKLGAVSLDKTDVGLSNVRNVSGYSQSETDTLLDGKLNIAGTAVAANQLANARTISLSGDLSGSASFNGSADITITGTVANDSHNHTAIFDKGTYSAPFDDSTNTDNVFSAEGLSHVFVRASTGGWPLSYGKLLNVPGYASNGGGALQILTPYALSYSSLGNPYFRNSDYSTGNWSGWKQFLDLDSADGRYLPINAKADDANLLDGINSSQFLRSDTSDSMSGTFTLNGSEVINTSSSSWAVRGNSNGSNHSGIWFSGDTGQLLLRDSGGTIRTTLTAGAGSVIGGSADFKGDISITKNNPWMTLDSSSGGDNGGAQGAGITIGESGYKAAAALHLTYTGDGVGHIGMGTVTNSVPQYEAIRLGYQTNTVTLPGSLSVGGSITGNGSGLNNVNATTLDGLNSTQFLRSDASDTFNGQLNIRHTNVQLNLVDSTYSDNYWQFDHQNGALSFRYNGGSPALSLAEDGDATFSGNSYFNSNGYAAYFNRDGNARSHIKFTKDGTSEWSLRVEANGSLNLRRDSGTGELQYNGNKVLTEADNVNADTLDGIDSSGFLRSNTTDYVTGLLYLRNDILNETGYRDHGVYGSYDSTKTNHIWSMGTGYRSSASGADFGNLYGLAYKHTNNTTGGSMGGSHQMVWCQNGSPKCSLGTGIWTSGNVTAYSDIRVKTNIEVIPEAVDKVKRLSGYTFERTDVTYDEEGTPETPIRQTGVIAQEVLEVLPEAVTGGPTEDDPDGHYSVAYGNMVGLLIEAVKEQQTQIDELIEQIKTLKGGN